MEATWKTGKLLSCVVILVGAIVGAGWLTAGDDKDTADAARQKWQHLALTHPSGDLTEGNLGRRINKLGEEGWELVAVEGFTDSGTTAKTVFFFKRRL